MMAGLQSSTQGCVQVRERTRLGEGLYTSDSLLGECQIAVNARLDFGGGFGRVRGRGRGVGDQGPPGSELGAERAFQLANLIGEVALGGAGREGLANGGKGSHETAS